MKTHSLYVCYLASTLHGASRWRRPRDLYSTEDARVVLYLSLSHDDVCSSALHLQSISIS